MQTKEITERFAAGNRRSPYYVLSDDEIKTVNQEIEAIGADMLCKIYKTGNLANKAP